MKDLVQLSQQLLAQLGLVRHSLFQSCKPRLEAVSGRFFRRDGGGAPLSRRTGPLPPTRLGLFALAFGRLAPSRLPPLSLRLVAVRHLARSYLSLLWRRLGRLGLGLLLLTLLFVALLLLLFK